MVSACTFRKKEEREKKGGGGGQEQFGNRFASTKSKKLSETETALIFDIPGGYQYRHEYNEKLKYDLYTVKKKKKVYVTNPFLT